jgi:hypothetical protein
VVAGKTITCRRCRAARVAELGGDDEAKIRVPPGWQRIVVLSAGSGTWLTADDLDAYEVSEAYWLCAGHRS